MCPPPDRTRQIRRSHRRTVMGRTSSPPRKPPRRSRQQRTSAQVRASSRIVNTRHLRHDPMDAAAELPGCPPRGATSAPIDAEMVRVAAARPPGADRRQAHHTHRCRPGRPRHRHHPRWRQAQEALPVRRDLHLPEHERSAGRRSASLLIACSPAGPADLTRCVGVTTTAATRFGARSIPRASTQSHNTLICRWQHALPSRGQ